MKKGSKHLGYLTTELASRYSRLDQLELAAEKLNLVRALMTHKGGSSRVVKATKKASLTDAVINAELTSNALALHDTDDDEQAHRAKPKVYTFTKQRKR